MTGGFNEKRQYSLGIINELIENVITTSNQYHSYYHRTIHEIILIGC